MHGNQRKLFSVLYSTWIGVSKLCEFFPDLGLTTGAVHAKEN